MSSRSPTPSALCSFEQKGPAQSRAQSRPGQASDACDRTAAPLWSAVGVGLHLLSLAYAGTVARASLAGMTEVPAPSESTAQPSVRELADIPAVEVITRSAVMLMSAAAEKLGLSSDDPDEAPGRDLGEVLAVHLDTGCLQALDEPVVGDLVDAGLSADGASYVVLSRNPTPSALCSIEQKGPAQSRAQSRPGQASDACDRTAAPLW